MKILGLALYGPQAASHRVRLSQFKGVLGARGINLTIQSLLDDEYIKKKYAGKPVSAIAILKYYWKRIVCLSTQQQYDAVILYCELFPFAPAWLEKLILKKPYIYDLDDAFYLKYSHLHPALTFWLQGKIDSLMKGAAAITAGNYHLTNYAKKYNNNCIYLPSTVDTSFYTPIPKKSPHNSPEFTVGWIGSPSTAPYLEQVVKPLALLGLEREVRLIVIGGIAPQIPNVQIIEQSWSQEKELDLIQHFDIGIMPIPSTDWAKGKCAFKLIQYMSCGIPVIASAVGANLDAVPEQCGWLVTTEEEWFSAFNWAARNPGKCKEMGQLARKWTEKNYSVASVTPSFVNAIFSCVDPKNRSCDMSVGRHAD